MSTFRNYDAHQDIHKHMYEEENILPKPKTYTMFVSFSAMDMEQAIEYIHDLDDKDIRSCIEEEE